ncbi:MAG: hypothetical protein JRE40_04300 [Deltaproteobacteria bacterium]|nr:hypothetical protein [Deltaproteobacteria bacterium]
MYLRLVAVLMLAALAISSAACTAASAPEPPTGTPEATSSTGEPALTDVVADILSGRVSAGETVSVVGYCRGWDVLDEVDTPPVTKSDWVLRDRGAAIYVLRNDVEVTWTDNQPPQDLLSTPQITEHLVEVIGVVRESEWNRQRYIEPQVVTFIR